MLGVKQHDNRDCGAACVATIFRYYGLKIPLIKVREKMKVDKNGSSLYAISRCAKEFNFITEVLEGTFSELEEEINNGNIKLPIIVHCLNEGVGHFIIVKKFIKNKIKIFDPAKGNYTITKKEFKSKWTGYLVTIEKGENFKKSNLRKGFYLKYWKIFIHNKNILYMILALSLLLSGITMISSLAYQKIIDSFILKNKISIIQYEGTNSSVGMLVNQINIVISNFHLFFIALVVIFTLQMALSIIKGIFIAKIAKRVNKELINNYLNTVVRLPIGYFKDRETGEILSRFSDVNEIRNLISDGGITIMINIFMIVAGGAILININSSMFLMVMGILFLYAVIVLSFKYSISIIKFNIFEKNSQLVSKLKEMIDNIGTIKNCSAENKFLHKIKGMSESTLQYIYKGEIISGSQIALLNNVEHIGSIFILWYGSYLVIQNRISLGSLIAFVSLVGFFLSPFQQLISMQIELQGAFIAMDRLNDILEVETEETLYIGKKEPTIIGKDIVYDNVTFGYNYDDNILENINIRFESGKNYALIGKSGCGKSTLMQLLLLHYQRECGSICVGENRIEDISLNYLRKKIKYVSADSKLFEGSILENILFESVKMELDSTVRDIINGCGLEEVLDILPQGIYSKISEGGTELSSGQRQRIILARALLADPEVLILDEATSHLDVESEKKIFKFVLNYTKGITCICILHNLDLINLCDKVLLMDHGKLISKHKKEILQ